MQKNLEVLKNLDFNTKRLYVLKSKIEKLYPMDDNSDFFFLSAIDFN